MIQEIKTQNPQKNSVLLVSDNGPDWSPRSPQTFYHLGDLWFKENLDCLVLVSYMAGHSRFNMVEHAWAPLTRALTGVTLPNTLDGEAKAPADQTNLTTEEVCEKEIKVFDCAIDILNGYWSEVTFDGYPVHSIKVPCGEIHHNEKDENYQFLCKAGIQELTSKPEYQEKRRHLNFLGRHATVRSYGIEFYKCDHEDCTYCSQSPIKSKRLFNTLKSTWGQTPHTSVI